MSLSIVLSPSFLHRYLSVAVVGCTPLTVVLTRRNCSATLYIVYIFLTGLLLLILVVIPTGVLAQHCWSLAEISAFAVYLTNPAAGSVAAVGLWGKGCRLKQVKGLELR